MSNWQHDQAVTTCGPRHVGLDATGKSRAVAAFGFTALQTRCRETAVAVQLATEDFECMSSHRRVVREVFSDCVLIEDDRDEWPGRSVRHLASPRRL